MLIMIRTFQKSSGCHRRDQKIGENVIEELLDLRLADRTVKKAR